MFLKDEQGILPSQIMCLAKDLPKDSTVLITIAIKMLLSCKVYW